MSENKIYHQTKRILILTTVLFSLLNVALVGTIYFSIIAMDLSSEDISLSFLVFLMTIGTFPLVCSFSIIFSWILFAKENYRYARIIALLPLFNVVIAFLIWVFLA